MLKKPILLLILVIGGAAAYAWWSGERAWADMTRALASAQTRLDAISTVRPQLHKDARPGDAQESYDIAWRELNKLFEDDEALQKNHPKAYGEFFLLGAKPGPLNSDQERVLDVARSALDKLTAACRHESYAITRNGETKAVALGPGLGPATRLLNWRVQHFEAAGQASKACDTLLDLLRIADDFAHRCSVLDQAVGCDIMLNCAGLDATSKIMDADEPDKLKERPPVIKLRAWPPSELRRLASGLKKLDRPSRSSEEICLGETLWLHAVAKRGADIRGTIVRDWRSLFSGTMLYARGLLAKYERAMKVRALSKLPWPEQRRKLEALDAEFMAQAKQARNPVFSLSRCMAASAAKSERYRLFAIRTMRLVVADGLG